MIFSESILLGTADAGAVFVEGPSPFAHGESVEVGVVADGLALRLRGAGDGASRGSAECCRLSYSKVNL